MYINRARKVKKHKEEEQIRNIQGNKNNNI